MLAEGRCPLAAVAVLAATLALPSPAAATDLRALIRPALPDDAPPIDRAAPWPRLAAPDELAAWRKALAEGARDAAAREALLAELFARAEAARARANARIEDDAASD